MSRRWAIVAFLIALGLAAVGPMRGFLFEQREAIDSVPSGFTGADIPLRVGQGDRLCATSIPFDAGSQVARMTATSVGRAAAPRLRVSLIGTDKRWRTAVSVRGGWRGARQLDVPLPTPPRATFGRLCIETRGPAPIDMGGMANGRGRSRADLVLNGAVLADQDLKLTLVRRGTASLASQWDRAVDHAAGFWPGGSWLLWLLTFLVVVGVPLGVMRAMSDAIAADERGAAAPRAPPS